MGEGQVVRGLEKCVSSMRKGETCELICRSEYAYGDAGQPPDVPAGASVWKMPKSREAMPHRMSQRYKA